jgi:N-hydroxyarylamine O-acetyltransferase
MLSDYLHAIGVATPSSPTLDALCVIHLAHRETFLFENLDIQRGRPIDLDLAALERKFLRERRGGYCFEQNTMFHAVLGELGFGATRLLARVRRGPPEQWVRTHMLLRVDVAGEPWIADVGFGGVGLLEPLPLREGASSEQGGLTYTLRREGWHWVLAMRDSQDMSDLYEFTEEPQTAGDVEIANHYTSTHPNSIFRRTLTIQRAGRSERTILRGHILARYRDGVLAEEVFPPERLREVARSIFSIDPGSGPFVFESYGPG